MADPVGHSSSGVALIAGRYELVREISAHGDVLDWEGFDSALQRRVRVQLVRPELVTDPGVADRFWQAARSDARSSKLTGERILDGGTDPETGRVFVVREWPTQAPALEGATAALPIAAARPGRTETEGATAAARPGRSESDRAAAAARSSRSRGDLAARPHFKSGRIVLLGVVIVAVIAVSAFALAADGWLAWVNTPLGQVSRSVLPSPVAVQPTVAPSAQLTATPSAPAATPRAPTAPPTPSSGVARRIVNTDGRGVALRSSPGGDRLPAKGYDEGVTVTAFESSGEWTRIRGSDGREGWVLSVTLAPQ